MAAMKVPQQRKLVAYVGSRTTRERNARGAGLGVYELSESGPWQHRQTLSPFPNPAFLALDHSQRFVYAVHGDFSDISAYRIEPGSGELVALNRVSTEGRNPVHVAVAPGNRFIVVANHLASTVVTLECREDGALGAVVSTLKLEGKPGPHRVEQPFAKPHQVEFDRSGRYLLVPDKGLDQVFVLRLDAGTGALRSVPDAGLRTREGAGPRHVAFHPGNAHVFVINELDSTVIVCRFDAVTGKLMPVQVVSSLPDTYIGDSRGAEIVVSPDGRFVYATNRGHDSIVAFHFDAATGRLARPAWTGSGGRTPRFFAFDPTGRRLWVANEDSDCIVGFAVHPDSGALAPLAVQAASTGSPVCIVFAYV